MNICLMENAFYFSFKQNALHLHEDVNSFINTAFVLGFKIHIHMDVKGSLHLPLSFLNSL